MICRKIALLAEKRIAAYCAANQIDDWLSIRTVSQLETVLRGESACGLLFFPLFLHQFGKRAGDVLSSCLSLGKKLAILEYRTPERNLDYPAYAACCLLEMTGSHFEVYRDFMQSGGLEGLLFRARQIPRLREVMLGGAASFVCLTPVDSPGMDKKSEPFWIEDIQKQKFT